MSEDDRISFCKELSLSRHLQLGITVPGTMEGGGGRIKNVQTNEVSHCSVSNIRYLLFPAIEQCNFCQHGTACAASLNANPASLAPAEHT